MKLLVVEDEKELRETLAEGLMLDGFSVDTAMTGGEAYEAIQIESYDVILLDINLPEMSGFELIQKIRSEENATKIIILTAKSDIMDKVYGLDLGADDYLTKPFDFRELEARIRTLIRRESRQLSKNLSYGKLRFDTKKRTFYVSDCLVELTKKEAGIIEYLLLHSDRIVSAEELIEHVWDSSVDGFSNAVRVHLFSLRKKIRQHAGENMIQNKIGEGYYLTSS